MMDIKQRFLNKVQRLVKEEATGFLSYFEKLVPDLGIVAISGSLPKGLNTNFYSRMIGICNKYNIPVVLDCSGIALLSVLDGDNKPTVIKPNTEELSQCSWY